MFTGKPLSMHVDELRRNASESKRKVLKANTGGGIPSGFRRVQKPLLHFAAEGYYQQNRAGETITIAEYSGFYSLNYEQNGSDPTNSIDPTQVQTNSRSRGIDISKLKKGVGGAVVLGLAAALGRSSSDKSSSSTSSTRTPQTPTTTPREKDYNLFVSHAWDYSEDYQNLLGLLDDVDGFSLNDYSVPRTNPKDVETDAELTRELEKQIRASSAVIVSAGMYVSHRDWILKELRIADEMDKPIIGVRKHGNEMWPKPVKNTATRMVNWNRNSVASAIAEEVDDE